MPTGDFPPPDGMRWSDASGWIPKDTQVIPMSKTDHTGSGVVSGEKPWHRMGATLYTLRDAERRYPGLPDQVNDNWFAVQGPDAEAVAERIHAALASQPAPVRAPQSDRPLTGTPDAGGDLGELARLSEAAPQGPWAAGDDHNEINGWVDPDEFRPIASCYGAFDTWSTTQDFIIAAVNYVRKLLSASSSPAAAGGADRDVVAAAWDLLLACEADCSTDDIASGTIDENDADDEPVGYSLGGGGAQPMPTALQFGHMRRLRKALLALTPRPAGPGAQAQSPDLGATTKLAFRTGDVAIHRPSGETRVVAYADPQTGMLSAFGWPDSEEKISDCYMLRPASDVEHRENLSMLKRSGDRRALKAIRLYGDPDGAALHPLNPAEAPIPESEVRT